MVEPRARRLQVARRRWSCPTSTTCSGRRSRRRSRMGSSVRCSAWAASGAPSGSSGRRRLHDRRRLRGRLHTERDLRGGLRRADAEVVLAVYDPAKTSYEEMLRLFWENHDPTQGMRQGNDVGTQYRSTIYWEDEAQRPRPSVRGRSSSASCGMLVTARSRPRSSRWSVLLRRAVPPAVPGEEPERLLRARRDRRQRPVGLVTTESVALQCALRRGVEQSGSSPGS